uniref:Major sperm protein n=4 Tax=Caenorhabditis japonica TaxID=281687 RepID=A0A8R1IZK6_CAEJA
MAQSVPPGDIATQPNAKIVFNAPYDDKHTYHIKVINSSARRIGYGIKTTNMKRLGVDPPCGVLDPKEAVLLAVSCDAFAYGQEDTNNDRITIEWTNTPGAVFMKPFGIPNGFGNAFSERFGKKGLVVFMKFFLSEKTIRNSETFRNGLTIPNAVPNG